MQHNLQSLEARLSAAKAQEQVNEKQKTQSDTKAKVGGIYDCYIPYIMAFTFF